MRSLLLLAAWLATVSGMYLSALGLDIYWNLVDWRPKLDLLTVLLSAGFLAGLIAAWKLSRTMCACVVFAIGGLLCLALLGAGVYALHPEDVSQGLLGRDHASPGWYRGIRALLMSLPVLFWTGKWTKDTARRNVRRQGG